MLLLRVPWSSMVKSVKFQNLCKTQWQTNRGKDRTVFRQKSGKLPTPLVILVFSCHFSIFLGGCWGVAIGRFLDFDPRGPIMTSVLSGNLRRGKKT